jgi:tetratricopeptide (TPR) repeat protein
MTQVEQPPEQTQKEVESPFPRRPFAFTSLALALLTLAVYSPIFFQELTSWDDPSYITNNPYVQRGITKSGIQWALTTGDMGNYHPLTWLSLMLDVEVFGNQAWGFKLDNLLQHLASAILLHSILTRTTGRVGLSFFVAALFAIHPIHVESVAWASERKDTLSTLFAFLAIFAYVLYTERRSAGRYLLVVCALGLSLLSKQMYVTLPFLLLLLDFWPLSRIGLARVSRPDRARLSEILWEKVPLLAISVAAALAVYWIQGTGAKGVQRAEWPPVIRAGNAAVAAVTYLQKSFAPVDLYFFYPYPPGGHSPLWMGVSAGIVAACSLAALLAAKRWPFIFVGWSWYLLTLLPVSGLVQVGWQAYADRYSYFPLIGLFILLVWLIDSVISIRPQEKGMVGGIGLVLLLGLGVLAFLQVRTWDNTRTMAQHALLFDPTNDMAHAAMGNLTLDVADWEKTKEHFETALKGNPVNVGHILNVGLMRLLDGNVDEAEKYFHRCQEVLPLEWNSLYNLAMIELSRGELDLALEHLNQSEKSKPSEGTTFAKGVVLARQGKFDEAIDQWKQLGEKSHDVQLAIEIVEGAKRGDATARWRFTRLYEWPATVQASRMLAAHTKDLVESRAIPLDQGLEDLDRALKLWPNNTDAMLKKAILLGQSGKVTQAKKILGDIISLDPKNPTILQMTGKRPR